MYLLSPTLWILYSYNQQLMQDKMFSNIYISSKHRPAKKLSDSKTPIFYECCIDNFHLLIHAATSFILIFIHIVHPHVVITVLVRKPMIDRITDFTAHCLCSSLQPKLPPSFSIGRATELHVVLSRDSWRNWERPWDFGCVTQVVLCLTASMLIPKKLLMLLLLTFFPVLPH